MFGMQELEAAVEEAAQASGKDAAVAAAQAAIAAGAFAGPGEADKAAAALAGVSSAVAAGVEGGVAAAAAPGVVKTAPVVDDRKVQLPAVKPHRITAPVCTLSLRFLQLQKLKTNFGCTELYT